MVNKIGDKPKYTDKQMQAALCAWEWMYQHFQHRLLRDHFKDYGSSTMRTYSILAADIVLSVYDHMTEKGYDYVGAYDWGFVPDVLMRIDWDAFIASTSSSGQPYRPDLDGILLSMLVADKTMHALPQHRCFVRREISLEEYFITCRIEADRQWGYADLVSDHPDRVRQAAIRKEDPTDFIRWLGKKYNLLPSNERKRA